MFDLDHFPANLDFMIPPPIEVLQLETMRWFYSDSLNETYYFDLILLSNGSLILTTSYPTGVPATEPGQFDVMHEIEFSGGPTVNFHSYRNNSRADMQFSTLVIRHVKTNVKVHKHLFTKVKPMISLPMLPRDFPIPGSWRIGCLSATH
jgi:hypothetical protein